MSVLRAISRNSPLARLQAEEAFPFFPELTFSLRTLDSFGDKNKQIPLLPPEGQSSAVAPDFFTRELDEALLRGEADVAVHSAKDLPYPLPAGLELFALLPAEDQRDALVSRDNQTLAQLPEGAKVGTSSDNRRRELLALRPDLKITPIRGCIEERIAQMDCAVDALIVAVCALKRLKMTHRITEVLPFKTHPLQGHLAIVGRKGETETKQLFEKQDIRRNFGKVTLVGFGPGNPDLLTLGGHKALQNADVIFHDDLLDKAFLEQYAAEKTSVGKRKNAHRLEQEKINERLYQAAVAGKNVVRLKGGDPMIFAHGREEIDFLQSRLVSVSVISGISAAMAMAAETHIPLTHRRLASSVAFVTGHRGADATAPNADTLVYYMGGSNFADIARKLLEAGRSGDTPAVLVSNVSLPNQRTYYARLNELRYGILKTSAPVLLAAGETVAFENGRTQRVLLTGTRPNSDYPNAVHTPLISIKKAKKTEHLQAVLRQGQSFDWLVFTSAYGVRFFAELISEYSVKINQKNNLRIVSVGKETTRELNKLGLSSNYESATESATGIVDFFEKNGITGKRILLPRSDKGLPFLPETLERLGNEIIDLPVYTNTPNPDAEKVELSAFDKILFSSPSGVEAFVKLYGALPHDVLLIAKGETTFRHLTSLFLNSEPLKI